MSAWETAEERAARLFREADAELRPFAHVAWSAPDVLGTVTYDVGELAERKGISPRDARDKMVRDMMDNGASREWAETRTNRALRTWDRGARGGSIKTR